MGTIHKFEPSKAANDRKAGRRDQAARPSKPLSVRSGPMIKRGGGRREPFINSWKGLVLALAGMVILSVLTGMAGGGVRNLLAMFHP